MSCRNWLVCLILAWLAAAFPQGAGNEISLLTQGRGRTLVFLPGLGCPPEVWQEVADELDGSFRCVRISIHGFASAPPPPAFEIEALIQAIGDVLDREREGRPVLIGHSFGGFLALQVAARYPGRLYGLVIVDAYPFPMGALQPGTSPEQAGLRAGQLEQMLRQLPEAVFRAQQSAAMAAAVRDPGRQKQIADWIYQTGRDIYARCLATQLGGDLRPLLPKIAVPVLVAGTWPAGEALGWNRENTFQRFTEQYRGLARVQIQVHETSRHFLMYDDPAGLFQLIREFAASHE